MPLLLSTPSARRRQCMSVFHDSVAMSKCVVRQGMAQHEGPENNLEAVLHG